MALQRRREEELERRLSRIAQENQLREETTKKEVEQKSAYLDKVETQRRRKAEGGYVRVKRGVAASL